MKQVFIHAKSPVEVKLPEELVAKIPKKIGITTTIQHLHKIDDVMKQFPEGKLAGQVLGCNANSAALIKDEVDAFLFVGSGQFHPLRIAFETQKPVFKYNPFTQQLSEVSEEDIAKHEKKKMASLTKFVTAENVGILVSVKPGQEHMKKAKALADKKDKNYYIFIADTVTELLMEDFNFIDCWVNTACPRIADEKVSIVDIDDLKELEK